MSKNHIMELLAPAGSYEAFKAAVENGADAVYLGGKSFSARANAANFSLAELRRVVQYAHERRVAVYVTVNILIADREFSELFDYLFALYEMGVDAVILQDVGVASLLQSVLPELERHASTQMTVNNSWAIRHMEKLGFSRVVLAREVSAEEIKAVSEQTALEIEAFVHGALCISYSGQCLMSSFIGGRSGNRGTCAQPCRMKYQLVNDKKTDLLAEENFGDHLLSPKDINYVEELLELQRCGVYSLKVEGRMKRPEYVATVTRVYRQALDRALVGAGLGNLVTDTEKTELLQIFNRDFSTAYFYGNPGAELMSYTRPNNRGIRLGRIVRINGDRMEIKLEAFLRPGDGLEIWTNRGREGLEIRNIWRNKEEITEGKPGDTIQIEFTGKGRTGDRIFKTHDEQLLERARLSYQEGKEQRKRPLRLRLSGSIGDRVLLEAWDGERQERAFSATLAQRAEKRPLNYEYAYQQLSRLGTTPFWLDKLELETEEGLMIPVRELNDIRRQVVEGLLQSRSERQMINRLSYSQRVQEWKQQLMHERESGQNPTRKKENGRRSNEASERLTVAVSDLEGVRAALRAGAKRIAFGGESWRSRKSFSLDEIQEAGKLCKQYGAQSLWRLPRIINQGQSARWLETLQQAKQWPNRPAIVISNLGELEILRETDPEWAFETDFSLNVFNEAALAYFLRLGAERVTLSPELEHSQLEHLARWPKTELLVFGDLEMMVSEYCPVGSTQGDKSGERCSAPCVQGPQYLRDRMKYDFPVETDRDCRMHLFNVKCLNLYKELGQIARMGISSLRLQLDRATPAQIRDTVRVFLEGWGHALNGEKINESQLEEVHAYLAERYPEGFTKGHYFRGIL